MAVTVEQVKEVMKKRHISSGSEAEAAIDFVVDLLFLDVEDTEANEPYATRSIAEMRQAISKVSNLTDMLADIE